MVSPLYWVSALLFAVVLIMVLVQSDVGKEKEKSFRSMVGWVIFFCLQDTVWGLCGSLPNVSGRLFFLSSTLFHFSTVFTTFFWLRYVLNYIGVRKFYRKLLLSLDVAVIAFQCTLLVANFYSPVLFYIADGIYHTAFLRQLAFFNQYVVYLLIGLVALVGAIRRHDQLRKLYFSVFCFVLAPILTGVFQYLYPDGPFYSMGYFLGCFVVHLFVVSKEREALRQLEMDAKRKETERWAAEQVAIANTDGLTGLFSRRIYEEHLEKAATETRGTLTMVMADLDGLKTANDKLGHAAGDELLTAAAECMKQCLMHYGEVYRVGGDEFAAIIHASSRRIRILREDLEYRFSRWQGSAGLKLSVSLGFASKEEFPDLTIAELAEKADERMYAEKTAHHSGIDRREQQAAFDVLCRSYLKVLKVDLNSDRYMILVTDAQEKTADKGFADTLSAWLRSFAELGQVREDDRAEFLRKTEFSYLCRAFDGGKQNVRVLYHRKSGEQYRMAKMELIPAAEYSPEKRNVYLYVKDIDD